MKKINIKNILLLVCLVLVDFISKLFVINYLKTDFIIINNFLKFSYIKNTGAAFGIMGDSTIVLIVVTLIFIYYIIREMRANKLNKISMYSYTLILGGALGNLIDRIFRGYVIDFISFHLFGRDMAIFNMADTFITIGVILLVISIFKESLWKK
jgi:signal peptidase II